MKIIMRNDEVNRMEGRWYDVDNSVYNLARRMPNLKGVQSLVEAVEKGAITFKGRLTFNRLAKPAGAD
jgi:hypothetical protein